MGIGALNYQGVKSGIKLNDIIEEFKYAYKGQEIKAGDFVNYINGIAGKTEVASTPLSLGTTEYSYDTACLVDDNTVLIAYGNSSSYGYLNVVTIDNGVLKVGTRVTYRSTSTVYMGAVKIAKNRACVFYKPGGNGATYGVVVQVNGTVPSVLYSITVGGSRSTTMSKSYYRIADNKIFCTYNKDNRNSYYYALVISFGDTSATMGTEVSSYYTQHAAQLTPTKYLCTGSSYALIATVSGTTVTLGNKQQHSSGNITTRALGLCTALDENRAIVGFAPYVNGNNGTIGVTICSVNGTTLTFGTIFNVFSGSYPTTMDLLETNKIFATQQYTTKILTISGTTITAGTSYTTQIDSTNFSISQHGVAVLDKNRAFTIGYKGSATSGTVYSYLLGINDTVISNNIISDAYEQQVTLATQPPFDGIALSNGVGGDDTAHNQQVKIAMPISAYEIYDYVIPAGESVSKGDIKEVKKMGIGDITPKTWTTVTTGTSYKASDGTKLTASGYEPDGNIGALSADRAFDGDPTTPWFSSNDDASALKWIKLELPSAMKITKMKTCVTFGSAYGKNCKIQGSKDDSTWVDLFAITSPQTDDTLTEVSLNNTDYYKYYRICGEITRTGLSLCVDEWQVSEYEIATLYGKALQSGTSGDTIQIAVPKEGK